MGLLLRAAAAIHLSICLFAHLPFTHVQRVVWPALLIKLMPRPVSLVTRRAGSPRSLPRERAMPITCACDLYTL